MERKIKVGILTFHASHNYGSMLQTYALQTILEREGFQPTIINHRNLAQKNFYFNPKNRITKKSIQDFFLAPRLFIQNIEKWYKFEKFMSEFYHVSREHDNLAETERIINDRMHLDAIITGGDQIWNLGSRDVSLAYMLPFETPNTRRIAYSPSMGDGKWWIPSHYSHILKQLISDYDFPSIREESASVFLTELIGKDIPFVPDPTLLLNRQDWDNLAGEKPLVKGDYVFYYSPQPDEDISNYALAFAKRHGYKIVSSNKTRTKSERSFIACNNTGPKEFLNLVKFATVVCGRSLHLIIFSIVFHKPFFAIGKTDGMRTNDFLALFGLSGHFFETSGNHLPSDLFGIDWKRVDRVLVTQKQKGLAFLNEALHFDN